MPTRSRLPSPTAPTALVAVLAVASASYAAPITVDNFSFENPDIHTGHSPENYTASNTNASIVPSWTYSYTGGANNQAGVDYPDTGMFPRASNTTPLPGTADGPQYAYFNLQSGAQTQESFTYSGANSLGNFAPDTNYNLTVAVGQRNGYISASSLYTIELTENGIVVATTTGTATAAGSFSDLNASFAAGATDTGTIGIVLIGARNPSDNAGNPEQTAFDNVRLDATAVSAVPEPASLAIMACGSLALLARRRRPR